MSKPKWARPEWLSDEGVPADALTDLRATDNSLSVWKVENDGAGLDLAVVALAANFQRLDKLDYTLVGDEIVAEIAVKCIVSAGTSPHSGANASMHRDLVELTVYKVAELAHRMMPLNRVRVSERRVKQLLLDALGRGVLDREKMDVNLLAQLDPR